MSEAERKNECVIRPVCKTCEPIYFSHLQSNPFKGIHSAFLFYHLACVFCCCIISMHKSDFESIQKWTLCNNAKKAKQKGPSIFIALFQYQTILLFTWTRLYSRHKNRLGFIASSLPPLHPPIQFTPAKMSIFVFFVAPFLHIVCKFCVCIFHLHHKKCYAWVLNIQNDTDIRS